MVRSTQYVMTIFKRLQGISLWKCITLNEYYYNFLLYYYYLCYYNANLLWWLGWLLWIGPSLPSIGSPVRRAELHHPPIRMNMNHKYVRLILALFHKKTTPIKRCFYVIDIFFLICQKCFTALGFPTANGKFSFPPLRR